VVTRPRHRSLLPPISKFSPRKVQGHRLDRPISHSGPMATAWKLEVHVERVVGYRPVGLVSGQDTVRSICSRSNAVFMRAAVNYTIE